MCVSIKELIGRVNDFNSKVSQTMPKSSVKWRTGARYRKRHASPETFKPRSLKQQLSLGNFCTKQINGC